MVKLNDKATYSIWYSIIESICRAMVISKTQAPKTDIASVILEDIDRVGPVRKAAVDYEPAKATNNLDTLAEIGSNFHFFILLNKYEKSFQEHIDKLHGVRPEPKQSASKKQD